VVSWLQKPAYFLMNCRGVGITRTDDMLVEGYFRGYVALFVGVFNY
jgi:hypothetical protein